MNDRIRLDVDTCIEGLRWIILGVLEAHPLSRFENGHEYLRMLVIRTETGFKDKLASAEGEQTYDHMFASKLLESLLYEGCVENRFNTSGKKEWRLTNEGLYRYGSGEMSQPYNLDDFIYGLEETLLDAMIELGGDKDYIRLRDIANECGFEVKLHRVASEPVFSNAFTHTILHYLLRERRVHKSLRRPGEWKLTDSELQKRRK